MPRREALGTAEFHGHERATAHREPREPDARPWPRAARETPRGQTVEDGGPGWLPGPHSPELEGEAGVFCTLWGGGGQPALPHRGPAHPGAATTRGHQARVLLEVPQPTLLDGTGRSRGQAFLLERARTLHAAWTPCPAPSPATARTRPARGGGEDAGLRPRTALGSRQLTIRPRHQRNRSTSGRWTNLPPPRLPDPRPPFSL